MPTCFQCGGFFKDWLELSKHVMANKKTHKKGRRFAAGYISKSSLSYKAQHDIPQRTPLLPEEKEKIAEAKESIKVELSGVNKIVNTVCPKCKSKSREALPVEHVNNPFAWRIGDRIAKVCGGCSN